MFSGLGFESGGGAGNKKKSPQSVITSPSGESLPLKLLQYVAGRKSVHIGDEVAKEPDFEYVPESSLVEELGPSLTARKIWNTFNEQQVNLPFNWIQGKFESLA